MSTRVYDASVFIGSDDSTYTSTSSNYQYLTIWGDTLQVVSDRTPSSSSDIGNKGEICKDNDYIYVCTASDTWKRIGLSSF